MRYGPYVFLGVLFALAASWLGMIATPQLQLGNQQPTNVPPANVLYPVPYPGLANLGQEVYRANGCAYCHTQVIRQERTLLDVVVTSPGTNQTDVVKALRELRDDLSEPEAQQLLSSAPAAVLRSESKAAADSAQKALSNAGAEANVKIVPIGADIQRGWGLRLTVGPDYLFETPLMLGTVRLGPDLMNVGLRRPDEKWHLIHLYDPRIEVPGSIMPRYPFLFEKRKKGDRPSPDALPIQGDYEIIPTPAARALVAYILNLRADAPLFQAPAPFALPAAGQGGTNQPAGDASTNAVPAGTNSAPATPNTNQSIPTNAQPAPQ